MVSIARIEHYGENDVGRMNPRHTVFMVAQGTQGKGQPLASCIVSDQADSIRSVGWDVRIGIVDDRTSMRGITRNVRRLKGEIACAQPGVLHAQYGTVTAAVARLVRGDIPLVVSFCGDDLLGTPEDGAAWRIRERIGRSFGIWAARDAAAVIVKSRNLYQALPEDIRGKAVVIPNGVDLEWFMPLDRGVCRERLGWPKNPRVVLFNASRGDNRRVKNPALAHAAMKVISNEIPDVILHTIFDSDRKELRWMMNAADCLLVTSLHEGSPNIVKEAMACNLPVVSVPCGDVAERLDGTWPGGVGPYDGAVLAGMIASVLRAGCRSNGRERMIAQGLSANAVAERIIGVYRGVTKRD
jgi:teichuronic acid biosynthesis glycosyltransferase TuaC